MSNGLTKQEINERATIEAEMLQGKRLFENGFVKMYQKRLYRNTHKTFEAYVKDVWFISKTTAYEIIAACETRQDLSGKADEKLIPEKTAHLAEVAKAPKEKQPEVLQRAQDIAEERGNGTPTTKEYKQAVAQVLLDAAPSDNGEPVYEDVPEEEPEGSFEGKTWNTHRKCCEKAAEALRRHVADLCRARRRVGKRDRVLELTDEALQILKGW